MEIPTRERGIQGTITMLRRLGLEVRFDENPGLRKLMRKIRGGGAKESWGGGAKAGVIL